MHTHAQTFVYCTRATWKILKLPKHHSTNSTKLIHVYIYDIYTYVYNTLKMLHCLRDCNASLRWAMLHRNCRYVYRITSIYLCICIHIYIYACIWIYINIYLYIYIYTYVCIYLCGYIFLYIYYVCIRMCIYIYTYSYPYSFTFKYIYMYNIYIHSFIYV